MTKLFNDPSTFMEDALDGFVLANARYVAKVSGGVVRAQETKPGKVAVVVGGGSGHYPAFCGVVGPGFADGAVVGNIFTSPSTDDAYRVAKAADGGGGVLFSTGNYAGDVMNFNLAKDKLVAEGIDTRNVYVTDDVASAPVEDAHKRRGIAGDFVVFKAASAAAEAGLSLDEVERIAVRANERTRTMGVGLAGCTMPGATEPLFTVPEGMMGVGLGIHGEPGIAEEKLPSASDLADLLVDRVIAEKPDDAGPKVGAILNGLGATKYEELFVVWGRVARRLDELGLEVVDPEVGELVTSLDMAGISLTLVYLDDELETYWRAGADTPAYKKGGLEGASDAPARSAEDLAAVSEATTFAEGSPASQKTATQVLGALEVMAATIADAEAELGRIDAVAGDGDHGRGMVKGVNAAVEAARGVSGDGAGVETLLARAGEAWAAKAGGTSGVLWGQALKAFGASLGDTRESYTDGDTVEAVQAFLDTLTSLGKASLGDKTMVDALTPFVETLRSEVDRGASLAAAWASAAEVATKAADETAQLRPKVGRARPLAKKSVGTPDAGAISFAMCMTTVGEYLAAGKD
ncbi:dihydroxyacetone kinase family protein [Dermacoccus barathri]|uniref:dihydroxyacetone kinase family protein n=1 Tax=Dermacoccus barathri TaxID=322601 RepID=UPI001879A8F9|nr:dihydroxyacetone kinase family protein [Dermacoccus barathri]MBE7372748.1 dihydroxyacetone kinase family protein [Dermacoccus barathri]